MVLVTGPNNAPLRWKSGKLVNDIFCYEHKANDWLDQAENAFIHDERVKIVGPKWSVLRDFHNLHKQQSLSGSAPSITSNLWPDCGEFSFVRRKGDNSVIFGDTAPHSPGGFFNKIDTEIIQENFNYFRNGNRPEPKNHSISPVLVEIKYSHEIYIDEDGSLCLAMFPAFALWNPYDTAIELGSDDHYELDIKIEDLRIRGFNTKDWEIYQKWRKHENEREWMARKAKAKQNPSIPSPPRPTPITIAKEPAPRPPAREPVISPGTPFIDLNGNGRRDAGEFMESPHKPKGYGLYPPKGGGGGGGGGGGLYQHQRDPLIWYMWNKDMGQKQNKNTVVEAVNPSTGVFTTFAEFRARIADFPDFPAFYPLNNFDRAHENEKRIPLFRPLAIMPAGERRYLFNSKANGRVLNYRDAPLRLTARGVRLEPGEKAYFVPQTITDAIPSDHYKVVVMAKGTEAAGNHLRYKAPEAYFKVPAGDPVTVRSWAKGIKGYNRGDRDELFIDQTSILGAPNGIILNLVQGGVKYPIKKINKNFGLDLDGNTRSFDKASDLMNFQGRLAASNKFGGAGFRLRWKLPGTSRRMTFHEFNPRALVDGYQDGSGDLWEVEVFKNGQNRQNNNPGNFRSMAGRRISPFRRNWVDKHPYTESGGPFCKLCEDKNKGNGRWGGGSYYTDLDPHREIGRSKDGNSTVSDFKLRTPSRPWSNMPYQRNIPRLMDTEAHFGHFHERKEDNNRFSSPRVTMFEIPKSPMLSLMQFRHANLNSYSHSPAYVIGNSYATPQVGRYKKWGRVRRLLFQPQAQDAIETPWEQYKKFRVEYNWAGADRVYNVYPWDEENWNFELGSIRDTHSEHNHQNITMDLSYYSNEALFDGYFLTGGSKPSGGSAMDGQISPFRNPRLKPYYRNGEWARTQYADKSEIADESDNSIAKDQTIAADLLLEGAFNVNSTSVESWVAHLAALKGQAVKVRDLKDGFQVGALGSEETWSDSGATPFLRMSEPTGEGVPAQEPPNKDNDFWTGFVTLTDDQVRTLATKLVEEVKLRGPFLSLSDFVNRRVARMEFPSGNISLPWRKKEEWPSENRTTAQGLRGPVQAAIAKAELNNGGFSWSPQDTDVPEVPPQRFNQHILHDSSFGLHAVSLQNQHTFDPNTKKNLQDWGSGVRNPGLERSETVSINVGSLTDPVWQQDQVRYRRLYYSQAFSNGEAPENLLAVENLATGANMPGWLTQADALTPLAPVLTARSDTFVIRTYGESPAGGSDGPLKRWCEVTVQRLPDYVNSHVDAPHHRPHEPFADDDFDGIWTDGEEWLDLNLNRETARSGRLELKANGQGTSPDLPGGNNAGTFKVGISKDLKLEPDPDLESGMASTDAEFFSTKGINQRFGRKFRIVKFRWLTANEV
jgi:hypothetical protein